ncbi:hypothetical protein GALMADRAFT_142799 [Galerina marginata CBS 339.88]|uniref:Uncharacterized protein n=1 Tax=Galerina marginata (strain CBS 339.88) TaxID=685588 RepID=A0A067T0G1_GALM3|nr:hypothetical protein GALMADRAFT_142799 [Galerina marginata CBS 339.88]
MPLSLASYHHPGCSTSISAPTTWMRRDLGKTTARSDNRAAALEVNGWGGSRKIQGETRAVGDPEAAFTHPLSQLYALSQPPHLLVKAPQLLSTPHPHAWHHLIAHVRVADATATLANRRHVISTSRQPIRRGHGITSGTANSLPSRACATTGSSHGQKRVDQQQPDPLLLLPLVFRPMYRCRPRTSGSSHHDLIQSFSFLQLQAEAKTRR